MPASVGWVDLRGGAAGSQSPPPRAPEAPGVISSCRLPCALPACPSRTGSFSFCTSAPSPPYSSGGTQLPPIPRFPSPLVGDWGPRACLPVREEASPSSAGWGQGCPPSLLCGGRAQGSAHGEVRSTGSPILLQPCEPAGGKVLETDLQRRGPLGPANPVGGRDTLRESHLQLIKSLLCINVLLEPSQILGRPVFVAFREVFLRVPEVKV